MFIRGVGGKRPLVKLHIQPHFRAFRQIIGGGGNNRSSVGHCLVIVDFGYFAIIIHKTSRAAAYVSLGKYRRHGHVFDFARPVRTDGSKRKHIFALLRFRKTVLVVNAVGVTCVLYSPVADIEHHEAVVVGYAVNYLRLRAVD